jgi:DNA-binding LacI/PurR family transcriptional regulator
MRVAGFDDVKYAGLLPVPLTTVRQPCLEIGAAAAAAMLERVVHPETPARDILLDFRLVVRDSCGSKLNNTSQEHSTSPPVSRRPDVSS